MTQEAKNRLQSPRQGWEMQASHSPINKVTTQEYYGSGGPRLHNTDSNLQEMQPAEALESLGATAATANVIASVHPDRMYPEHTHCSGQMSCGSTESA